MSHRGVGYWNKLSTDIKSSSSLVCFRKKQKQKNKKNVYRKFILIFRSDKPAFAALSTFMLHFILSPRSFKSIVLVLVLYFHLGFHIYTESYIFILIVVIIIIIILFYIFK